MPTPRDIRRAEVAASACPNFFVATQSLGAQYSSTNVGASPVANPALVTRIVGRTDLTIRAFVFRDTTTGEEQREISHPFHPLY